MTGFHVLLALFFFYFVGALLHLVCFLVVLLLGQVGLNLAHVQQLSGEFES